MKIRLIVVLLWGLCGWGFSQNTGEEALFRSGLEAYKAGNYNAAANTYLRGVQDYPNGRLITSMRYMLARSYYKMGDFKRTEIVANFFYTRHSESSYLDDMHHLMGNTHFKERNYDAAVEEWMWVINNSKDPRLKATSGDYIYKTLDRLYTIQDIERVRARYQSDYLDGVAQVATARKLLMNGQNSRARSLLSSFLQTQENHPLAEEARTLLGAPTQTGATGSKQTIVFIKDSEQGLKEVADALESGMSYAIQEYRQRNSGSELQLTAATVSPTVYNAVATYKNAIIEQQPVAVIGPVDNDQTAAIAALAAYEERPFIAPLSSQTGLADLNPFVFQMNPDARSKGQFLGEYAAKVMGLKDLAVLAPTNQYGENFVQSFVEAAQAAGASVESIQWYYEDTQDFNAQFRAIWRKGIFLAYKDSVLQADPEASEASIQRGYRAWTNQKFQPRRPGFPVDSTDVQATGLDGLLIVMRSPDFMPYLAPQLAFNNIKTQLLGNEGWNDVQQLKKYRDYLEGMVFISPGYYDPESSNYRLFMNRFRNTMNTTPERFHLLGYDIMKWLLENYSEGITGKELRDRLERSRLYQGLIQSIQFGDKPRVNGKLSVLKLNYGQVIPLGF